MVYERSFEGEFTHLSQMPVVKTEVVKSNIKFRSSELELEVPIRTLPIASAQSQHIHY